MEGPLFIISNKFLVFLCNTLILSKDCRKIVSDFKLYITVNLEGIMMAPLGENPNLCKIVAPCLYWCNIGIRNSWEVGKALSRLIKS